MSQNGKRKIGWTPESKHNMRVLLKALLSVAEGELKTDDNPQLQQAVLTQWRTNTELRVTGKIGKFEGTTLQTLADMVKSFGDYLEPKDKITDQEERDKIRNVIHCLEALKLLVDERDKDYQKDLLAQCIEWSDYPYTITTTWRLAFEQIESTFPAAQTLLNLCAFLAPDEIPLELFRENSEELPENLRFSVLNPLDFENTIAVLRDYSLVQRNKDALSLFQPVNA